MGNAHKLELVRRPVDDVLVLDVVGDLVLEPANPIRQEVHRALEAGHRKIILNLAGMRYMDSIGTGLLVAAKVSALNRAVGLKVCCVPPAAAQLLARLQLTKILDVYEQESQALESFRA